MTHASLRPGSAVIVALFFVTAPAPASSNPRVVFESTRLELAEDGEDAYAVVRLVDCAAREPVGTVDVQVKAAGGTATEGVDFWAYGRLSLGRDPETSGRVHRSGEVPLAIVHDEEDESTEYVDLRIEIDPSSRIDCGDGPRTPEIGDEARALIRDVPWDVSRVAFATTEAWVTEADGEARQARIMVTRTAGRRPVSVVCQTTRAGTATEHDDFEPIATVLGWGENDHSDRWCEVPVLGDDLAENRETISLILQPLEGEIELGESRATLSVRDDDSPGRVQFSAVRFEAAEQDAVAIVGIERKWGSEGPSAVRLRLTPRGALPSEDYVAPLVPEVRWDAGQEGLREVRILLIDDNRPEREESLVLALEAADGGTRIGDLSNAIVVITDDDGPAQASLGPTRSLSPSPLE